MWLAAALVATAGPQAAAQEDGLLMDFDFGNASGTSVPDAATSGITATLHNQAKVVEMGKYHVLDLGNGTGYLDLTGQAGELFKGLNAYTLSMYYRVDENASIGAAGNFLWAFSTSTACTATEGKYSAYRLNAQRFAVSTGGYNNETGIELGGESEKGRWIHVVYTQNGSAATLYLDGERKGSVGNMPSNTTNFTGTVPYAWIGRAPFSADSYLTNTLVYGIRLYDKVLTATEISGLAQTAADLDHEYRYGEAGDFTALKTAIQEARDFVSGNASSYPAAALMIYEDEINMAQALVDEGKVNQSIIDEQLAALRSARTALEATAGFEFGGEGLTEGYDTDRGFRHPGALHTDADFERIRQQLQSPGGNSKVKQAYSVLTNAEYAQSDCATYPVETIVRGGGVGENYINAARGATIAYQNALRWKIDGSKEHARHAVSVLMSWARTTKAIGGDSNWALASGLYGYQFANAAELVRDYEGWSPEDFAEFKQWMLNLWYPSCITFLRGRQGTWENAGRWWQCPGHYWSNWGLCNALAVVSIGILCDDVFIYNQGMSFFKHDQVGTFEDPRTANPILNDGLTEFLGNLVVTTVESDLETGAYGKLGQMQESGRDAGHAAMAAGLAIDLAHIGWNQGDDLFSFMDHRLAAGIEYLAAQCQSIPNLPWTNYHYATSGFHWSDYRSQLQTGPALGAHIRPYWGTVIGHYEGVKGVTMPFSEWAYQQMGIDGGGAGATSGGYDHLGYSVLLNTRDSIAPANLVPTPLTPLIEYNGLSVEQSELGGLRNTYVVQPTEMLPAGTIVTFKPQLPDTVTDTGNWKWNTGETTRDLTIAADRSGVWRVTYTNANGVESEQVFTIAVDGDCEETEIEPYITVNGERTETNSANILYGSEVTLDINAKGGWGSYLWENGATTTSITMPNVTSDRDVSVIFTGQGGRKQKTTFHIKVQIIRPDFIYKGRTYQDTLTAIVDAGDAITLTVEPSEYHTGGTYRWSDGSTGQSLELADLQTSGDYTVTYTALGLSSSQTFHVLVRDAEYRLIPTGDYYIRHIEDNTYLTDLGNGEAFAFRSKDDANPTTQQWHIEGEGPSNRHSMMSVSAQAYVASDGGSSAAATKRFRIYGIAGKELSPLAITASRTCWQVDRSGNIDAVSYEDLNAYPFELVPVKGSSIEGTEAATGKTVARTLYYTLDGIRVSRPGKGIYIRQTVFDDGSRKQEKVALP